MLGYIIFCPSWLVDQRKTLYISVYWLAGIIRTTANVKLKKNDINLHFDIYYLLFLNLYIHEQFFGYQTNDYKNPILGATETYNQ